jgi:ferrochelatase
VKHIVLVTYGEPITPAFVDQLVYSWRILLGLTRTVADIPAPLIPLIALARGRGRNALWKKYSYSSPLEPITLAQAAQLEAALTQQTDEHWKVHVAYEFRAPLLSTVIEKLPAGDMVVVAPMYAADSSFTHDLSRTTVSNLEQRRQAPVVVLPAIDVEVLARISADHVMRALGADANTKASALVLAAHGTLLKPAKPIETGLRDTDRLRCRIEQRLSGCFGVVVNGWLNHTRGGQWTDPPIEEALKRIADAGIRDVVYYPYGFLADNAESQLEGQLAAAARPELNVHFVPCLNGSPELAAAIATQVLAAR